MIDLDVFESQMGPVKPLRDDKEADLRVLEEQHRQKDAAAEAGRRIQYWRRCPRGWPTSHLTVSGPLWRPSA